jgi:hypothetical protein
MAAHFREQIRRFGDHPGAERWKEYLLQLETHIENLRARNKARRQERKEK